MPNGFDWGGGYGFLLEHASHNNLTANAATANSGAGFYLEPEFDDPDVSGYNFFADNLAEGNGGAGFEQRHGVDHTTFLDNTASGNAGPGFVILSTTTILRKHCHRQWKAAGVYEDDCS